MQFNLALLTRIVLVVCALPVLIAVCTFFITVVTVVALIALAWCWLQEKDHAISMDLLKQAYAMTKSLLVDLWGWVFGSRATLAELVDDAADIVKGIVDQAKSDL